MLADDEINNALHLVQCDDIIAKLPGRVNTMLGTKGVYLSGRKQKDSDMRAILKIHYQLANLMRQQHLQTLKMKHLSESIYTDRKEQDRYNDCP